MSNLSISKIIDKPLDFGKVLVIYGGNSNERDVSLKSGKAVLEALRSKGINAYGWDPKIEPLYKIINSNFDRAWIALHGKGGEDGSIQGALEFLGIPYTGSDVLASSIAMNKIMSKKLFQKNSIPTPDYKIIHTKNDAFEATERLGLPMIIKPISEGSSIGMSVISDICELEEAVNLALGYNDIALAEECIIGDELTVTILNRNTLPSIRIKTPRVFYDYRAKYKSIETHYICPGTDDVKTEKIYADLALKAFDALGCNGWGRVDFMRHGGDVPKVLEVNTVPGMTKKSLVPMAALQSGIDFPDLCWSILETSIEI